MAYQVSRTDTGQFVLIDPATDTAVIDDELGRGFAKLEQAVADKPVEPAPAPTPSAEDGAAGGGSSAFTFRGGPRYTPILLAVVLPFAWLAVLYFALTNLLTEHTLGREAAEQTEAKVEALERELQALRSEIAGAPRTAKTKPKRREPKQPKKPKQPEATAMAESGTKPDGSSTAKTR